MTAAHGRVWLERALEILADLVAFPSVSGAPNHAIANYIEARLREAGARSTTATDASGDLVNVFATIGPAADGGVMLAGHTDVVAADTGWSADPFTAVRSGDRIIGRGACDMKAFLACTLAAAPAFAAADLKRPVHMAFTAEEEVGCRGAKVLIDQLALGRATPRPAICIVGEPTAMQIVEGHKGCFEYTTRFTGLSGHASVPNRGVNAIHAAARFVGFLCDLGEKLEGAAPPESPFDPPWTTIQAGRIAGGEARNVIAERASVEWEFRPVSEANARFVRDEVRRFIADALLPGMRAACADADITTEVIGEVDGLVPEPSSPAARLAMRLADAGMAGAVSFGTEAGLYQSAGISTVLCGPGSIEQAHTVDEFIDIEQIGFCLEMMRRLIRELEGKHEG
jgi:acetylornithine deacetylase